MYIAVKIKNKRKRWRYEQEHSLSLLHTSIVFFADCVKIAWMQLMSIQSLLRTMIFQRKKGLWWPMWYPEAKQTGQVSKLLTSLSRLDEIEINNVKDLIKVINKWSSRPFLRRLQLLNVNLWQTEKFIPLNPDAMGMSLVIWITKIMLANYYGFE